MTYFHEEQRFSSWIAWGIFALVGIPVALASIESLFRSDVFFPSLATIATFVPVAILLFMARLVVDVDRDEIRISFHFLWPTRRIPIAAVRGARAQQYSPLAEYGGWGVRLGWRGWAFNTSGSEGVLVETNAGKRVMIGSHRAKELEAAIARAVAERSEPH